MDENDRPNAPNRIVPFGEEILFNALIATAVDGIMVIDEAGTIQVYSDACERLFGHTRDEVVGQNVKMLMPPPYHGEHDGYLARYRQTGERRIIGIGREVVGRRKNGTTFAMYLSVGEGEVQGKPIFIGIVHDISERKAHEGRIRELQNELLHATRLASTGQLGAALAHELNQPLTAVLNYAAVLQELGKGIAGDDGDMLRDVVKRIAEQTERAGEIIRRLRGFVAKREPDRALQDLNATIEESIALGLVGLDYGNIPLKRNLAADLPLLSIDRVQIQQVMINLLRNAIEAMQKTPRAELRIVTARDNDGYVRVSVTDTGPGLPPQIASVLFQPFVTTKEHGLGIGLSICRTIVESHGGRLWVEPNQTLGTTFHFRLPVASQEIADGAA